MSIIYLSRFTTYAWLQYDLNTGKCEEVKTSKILQDVPDPSGKNADGRYDIVEGYIVGFYKTPKGPVMFCNDEIFPIYDRTYDVEIRRDKPRELHTFVMKQHNKVILSIPYKPNPTAFMAAFLEAEEDVDFLAWITTLFDKQYFYKRYTKDSPIAN